MRTFGFGRSRVAARGRVHERIEPPSRPLPVVVDSVSSSSGSFGSLTPATAMSCCAAGSPLKERRDAGDRFRAPAGLVRSESSPSFQSTPSRDFSAGSLNCGRRRSPMPSERVGFVNPRWRAGRTGCIATAEVAPALSGNLAVQPEASARRCRPRSQDSVVLVCATPRLRLHARQHGGQHRMVARKNPVEEVRSFTSTR